MNTFVQTAFYSYFKLLLRNRIPKSKVVFLMWLMYSVSPKNFCTGCVES